MARRGGFKLVELLVAAGVLAILTAIMLAAIPGARRAAHETVNRTRIAQSWTDHLIYETDTGAIANPGLPDRPQDAMWWYRPLGDGAVPSPSNAIAIYDGVVTGWPRLLRRHFGEPSEAWHPFDGHYQSGSTSGSIGGTFGEPHEPSRFPSISNFRLSSALLYDAAVARAQAWPALEAREIAAIRHAKRNSLADVAHPSAKAAMYDTRSPFLPDRWLVAMVDGSVRVEPPDAFAQGGWVAWLDAQTAPLSYTAGGPAGRDLR